MHLLHTITQSNQLIPSYLLGAGNPLVYLSFYIYISLQGYFSLMLSSNSAPRQLMNVNNGSELSEENKWCPPQ